VKHYGGDLEDESDVVVTMLSMASPCLNLCALGGMIRAYGGVPESVRGGIERRCGSSTHNRRGVVAWKAMWNTASPRSNTGALGGVPESVREDIEGECG